MGYSDVVETARSYYNSDDAHTFYSELWGGEDLHLGIYNDPKEPIFDASRRTIDRMASYAKKIDGDTRLIDLGGGFSGSARYLAGKFGCKVTVVNLSEVENQRGRRMNKEQNLDHLIEVVDGSYDKLPFKDGEFDIVWSQDALLHSDDPAKVMQEAARVLKPGGEMIFTDPMKMDDCPNDDIKPILKRINLSAMSSPDTYKELAAQNGLRLENFEELTDHLTRHYSRVLEVTEEEEDRIRGRISQEYIDNMKTGLQHWIDGGKNGKLTWGIFHFVKES